MAPKIIFKNQFDKSFSISKFLLLISGIKMSPYPWNKRLEHFVTKQLFYYNFVILYSVIFGEVYGVIDCIQTGKSFVELSFNLPCITISILATVKFTFLYLNGDVLVDLVNKLKEIHCGNDDDEDEKVINEKKSVMESVKTVNALSLLMVTTSVIVQVMFCLVPVLLMAIDYNKTGNLVVIYPFLVKYHYYNVYESMWWPLIYFHQVVATVIVCANLFGCDTLFCALCFYIERHFRLLGLQLEDIVTESKEETMKSLAKAVRRHQALIDLVNQMEFVYRKSTLFHMVTASLLICLSAFIITIADVMNIKLAFFTFLTMSLSQISLICFFADLLMKSSTDISQCVYKCYWYKADGDIKKMIFIVMIRSQKPCKLTAWNFVDLNLGAFTKILSTSWSYFALLRTMYN